MSKNLNITPEAERDIFAIASNIRLQDSLASARHALAEIKNHLNALCRPVESGRAGVCEETSEIIMTGLPYIAVYKISGDLITVVRILYGAEERRLQQR